MLNYYYLDYKFEAFSENKKNGYLSLKISSNTSNIYANFPKSKFESSSVVILEEMTLKYNEVYNTFHLFL